MTEFSIEQKGISSHYDTTISPLIINATVPDGVEIKPTKYGLGIFVTKFFSCGEVLYVGTWQLIDDDGNDRPIKLITPTGIYDMTVEMHTVGVGIGLNRKRQCFTFDSFMNHCCEPSTYSADEIEFENGLGGSYKTVALRDMYPGDEITCDYDLFEMDSREKR